MLGSTKSKIEVRRAALRARASGGYTAPGAFRNAREAACRVALAAGVALSAGGCSLSLHLASLQIDPEKTGAVSRPVSALDPALTEEDWRRAQAALSLAVDPQGSGQPVNWDNPASRRKGSFAAAGNLVLVDNTVCRPFVALLSHPGAPAHETRHAGRACRVGPGDWALSVVDPPAGETTAKIAPGRIAAAEPAPPQQPLPPATTAILETADGTP